MLGSQNHRIARVVHYSGAACSTEAKAVLSVIQVCYWNVQCGVRTGNNELLQRLDVVIMPAFSKGLAI